MDEESLARAAEGVDFICHTASPIPMSQPKDENELVTPAVNGTLGIMRAARRNGVKRMVMTSSCASIERYPRDKKTFFTLNETHWSDPALCNPYYKSKLLAEKAAWEFIENLPEGEKINLSVINPYVILGPALCKGDFTSAKIIIEIMKGNMPPPKIRIGFVDVRNVATAHMRALERDEAIGQRFILCSETVWFKEFNQILKEEYGKDYCVSTMQPPKFLMTMVGWFN